MITLPRLRTIALIEGSTLLLLLFVAVPLKHKLGMPEAVSLLGPVHGMAFLLYILALISALGVGLIDSLKLVLGTIAAFIPFGSFVFERLMLKEDRAES
ncbi:MAG: DUF3817 domain-containing protein [Granulosicoccaceae bacterium]